MPETELSEVGIEKVVPLLMVQSMEASVRYYVDGLGFVMTIEWVVEGELRWCWLQLGGAALMLQQFVPDDHAGRRSVGQVGTTLPTRPCKMRFLSTIALFLAGVYSAPAQHVTFDAGSGALFWAAPDQNCAPFEGLLDQSLLEEQFIRAGKFGSTEATQFSWPFAR